jgi:type IV secretory pathway VirB2 component (pilin)
VTGQKSESNFNNTSYTQRIGYSRPDNKKVWAVPSVKDEIERRLQHRTLREKKLLFIQNMPCVAPYQMKRKQTMLKLNKRYLTLTVFMAALMLCVAEPAFADDVSTKTTGFLQKIIDFLTDLRKPAITIICLGIAYIALFARQHMTWIYPLIIGMIIFIIAPYVPDWLS